MSSHEPLTPPLVADQTMPDFVFSRVYAILFQDQRKPHDEYGPLDWWQRWWLLVVIWWHTGAGPARISWTWGSNTASGCPRWLSAPWRYSSRRSDPACTWNPPRERQLSRSPIWAVLRCF